MSKRKMKGKPQGIKKLRKRRSRTDSFEIPNQGIELVAKSLKKKFNLLERESKYVSSREVLTLLAGGLFLAATVVMPGLTDGLRLFLEKDDAYDKNEWKKFNPCHLTKAIRSLEYQRLVEIEEKDNLQVVRITEKGKKKVLKYALDELEIEKPRIWDERWRFVTYDIPRRKNWLRNIVRDFLKRLNFYRFHESLYIHAYPCEDEIEFLREYLGASKYVKLLVVSKIENDRVFRDFFGV